MQLARLGVGPTSRGNRVIETQEIKERDKAQSSDKAKASLLQTVSSNFSTAGICLEEQEYRMKRFIYSSNQYKQCWCKQKAVPE